MQTVPSLVGTGTAIAAAASGFVFGQPPDTTPSTRRFSLERTLSAVGKPASRPRRNTLRASGYNTTSVPTSPTTDTYAHAGAHVLASSRPPLSRHQRPTSAQLPSPVSVSRRQSLARQGETSTPPIAEVTRESISSNDSWLRRLSVRPLSHHGSYQSSFDIDNTSIAFSHGSSAPILSPIPGIQPLPPNKLVKRTSPNQPEVGHGELPRPRSRSHRPTLKRPATSHQRSATLYQFRPMPELELTTTRRNYSFEQQDRTVIDLSANGSGSDTPISKAERWTSFFHDRSITMSSPRAEKSKAMDSNSNGRGTALKRISIASDHKKKVHLVKPRMVSGSSVSSFPDLSAPGASTTNKQQDVAAAASSDNSRTSAGRRAANRSKRSLSLSLSSAGNWVSRTSDNIRRPKRGSVSESGNTRFVSAPVSDTQTSSGQRANPIGEPLAPTNAPSNQGPAPSSNTKAQQPARQRHGSSPLPPPIYMSHSPHADVSRSGSVGGPRPYMSVRPNQPSGSSTSSAAMSPRRISPFERTSTIDASEFDSRDFSVDDDDTDFKSDGLFDSIRTVGSGPVRAVDSPLESMYDESPPSTAGNGKTKRLSIQEIMGSAWDEEENKILEEDENAQTPVRVGHGRLGTDPYHSNPSPSPKDRGRISYDDDFDEDDDWAKDEDAPFNPLSPPSKGSSLNSRTINPNVRLALANISGNGSLEANINDTISERPLSNLFDWSETPAHDRLDPDGHVPRPRTAYTKHGADPRGGRSATRKGPMPTHVRSQSVPVVHDGLDQSKPTNAKYGTWGMSAKAVSEDWDDDFEFGGSTIPEDGDDNDDMFAVPEAIRATQPSVKAHSGQIREFSLLVNDLKRLCRHGRDMNLIDGPYRTLWKEAEGIITLASPDDEETSQDDGGSEFSLDLDGFDTDDRFMSDIMDAESLHKLDAAIESHPAMSRTAVVRERPSPRRRSVFSPDDDIFGFGSPADLSLQNTKSSRPRTPESGPKKSSDVNVVVRHVMEAMQQRSIVTKDNSTKNDRVHFDTNSLKALVKRASDLRDILSDAIRKVEQITQSPARTPRIETRMDRRSESSPAFTRVFDEPTSTPPRKMPKSRSKASMLESTSPDNSPSAGVNRRMQMMTVG